MEQKSDKTKSMQGTLRKIRIKSELSYIPLTDVPPPSFKLTKTGMDYYEQFCSILLSHTVLTVADIPGITRAARWFELYKEADRSVTEKGSVQVTRTGYTQQTGYFTVMEKAEDRLIKFEALYGMNLTSRSKINIPESGRKNPFDEI